MADEIGAETPGGLTCALHSARSGLTVSLAPARRRHERWPDEERDRIVAESFTPGKTVAQVARDNGVGLGLLHYWRRQARAAGRVEELRFVPVTVGREEDAIDPAMLELPASVDLIVRDVTVRIRGVIAAEQLRAVLAAIRE
ncbi:MAG: transposase [Sphingomonadales bacterium]|nr:transposase [Sphingomonadales bacterium]MDE2172216.1 transposase [Sphingomonadales bacterium]